MSYRQFPDGPLLAGCPSCREEGYSRLILPGILVSIKGATWRIERCDGCCLYPSDEAAAQAVADAAERELLREPE